MNNTQKLTCPICGKEVSFEDSSLTHDCHGIPFRYVCINCWRRIMNEKGFDGEYYTDVDEQIDEDY